MAKYLGGIKNPDIEIYDIKSPGWFDFDFYIKYADYSADGNMQELSIYDNIVRYEELTSDSHRDYSLTWGIAGYLLSGPVCGILGAVLGSETKEKHVILCELKNGWQFALELDKDELKAWKTYMDEGVKDNTRPKIEK